MRNGLPLIILMLSFGTIFNSENQRNNEEIIKNCIQSLYRDSWEHSKQTIASAITEGVSTVDIQEYDTWGYTPLCCAIEKNDTEFAEFLLKNGANPHFELKGTHASKPIFFNQSNEMMNILKKYGTHLKVHSSEQFDLK